MKRVTLVVGVACGLWTGCASTGPNPEYDRPFPIGQVTDAHWETQQTNAEAADFILFEHEFVKDAAELAPSAKRHLESIALRLEHVPFPVVIEQIPLGKSPQLDAARRQTVVMALARMGLQNAESRVIVANAFPAGRTAIEAERTYYQGILSNGMGGRGGGGFGGGGGGGGGMYR